MHNVKARKYTKIDNFSCLRLQQETVFRMFRARARENLEVTSYKGDMIAPFHCSWQQLAKKALRDTA